MHAAGHVAGLLNMSVFRIARPSFASLVNARSAAFVFRHMCLQTCIRIRVSRLIVPYQSIRPWQAPYACPTCWLLLYIPSHVPLREPIGSCAARVLVPAWLSSAQASRTEISELKVAQVLTVLTVLTHPFL
jgi:hypothetical protein